MTKLIEKSEFITVVERTYKGVKFWVIDSKHNGRSYKVLSALATWHNRSTETKTLKEMKELINYILL